MWNKETFDNPFDRVKKAKETVELLEGKYHDEPSDENLIALKKKNLHWPF